MPPLRIRIFFANHANTSAIALPDEGKKNVWCGEHSRNRAKQSTQTKSRSYEKETGIKLVRFLSAENSCCLRGLAGLFSGFTRDGCWPACAVFPGAAKMRAEMPPNK